MPSVSCPSAAQLVHKAEEVKDMAASALHASAAGLQSLAHRASEGSATLARHSLELASAAATHTQHGMEAAVVSATNMAEVTRQRGREVADACEAKVLPAMQRFWAALRQALAELQQARALQLRCDEEVQGVAECLSRLGDQLSALAAQLRLLPVPAAAALALLSLRLATALDAVATAAVHELLYGRASLSRAGRFAAVVPGWLGLLYYRKAILQELPAEGGQAAVILARNARQLPPLFWLAALISGTTTLQTVKDLLIILVRQALQSSPMRAMSLAALGAVLVATYNRRHDCQVCARLKTVQSTATETMAGWCGQLRAAAGANQPGSAAIQMVERTRELKAEPEVEPQAEGNSRPASPASS